MELVVTQFYDHYNNISIMITLHSVVVDCFFCLFIRTLDLSTIIIVSLSRGCLLVGRVLVGRGVRGHVGVDQVRAGLDGDHALPRGRVRLLRLRV